jgi:hypothetical protein
MDPAQERALYERLVNSRVKPAPAGTALRVGQRVPRSVRLHRLPRSAAAPAAVRRYEFALAENRQVALVDPRTRVLVHLLGVGF